MKQIMIDISEIKLLCGKGALRWTNHALVRLVQCTVNINDVVYALQDNDYIHIVCGLGEGELWLITAYHPSPNEWNENFKLRKEGGA